MLDLILGILFFNLILVLFKLFERFGVDNLQAIVVNYVVASSLGIWLSDFQQPIIQIVRSEWMWHALMIGFFFVVVFNLLARGAQKVGMAVSTVANKMSVVIPVIFAIFMFGDTVSFLKILGIVLALVGVYLTSTTKRKLSFDRRYLWLIIVIFLGQGIADCIFNFAQQFYVDDNESKLFIAALFIAAFVTGLIMLIPKYISRESTFKWKNVLWGIALGFPNFGTVYYFFRSLESGFMESSQIYPVLNMGVIIISALSGYLLFKERLSAVNWLGILLSVIAIAAISLS
ncbi:MAG: DMT family transporter [Crocinitomicaceae bacterium]